MVRAEPQWRALLRTIYGDEARLEARFETLLARHAEDRTGGVEWSERDVWLITYPDQFRRPDEAPLDTLRNVYTRHLQPILNGVHILPFFPWTSDDGYSVADYTRVDDRYGDWSHISSLAGEARIMVDAVVNHMSAQSAWFRRWQADDPEYRGFFRTADPDADLTNIVRAREHPLLTPFETARGTEWVWTTFSADQVDLDFRNPEVLARMTEVLLDYASHGASMIRLDAICFLWKDEATPSIHLPQTHAVVQFLRACLDATYPHVGLISETNVPHAENISYLGDGSIAEAQAVYQFTLPPLVLYSYLTSDATVLADWARALAPPPPNTTFLNFLASHDGVGVRPLEGILTLDEVNRLADGVRARGGLVNARTLPTGESSPYELNATWYELVRGDSDGADALERHLGSHAVMLAMRGIPAVYVHSLFASRNDHDGVAASGAARSINRHKFDPVDGLESELTDPTTETSQCFAAISELLELRRTHRAFHPDAPQRILETVPAVFGIERGDDGAPVRVYVNVSGDTQAVAESGTLLLGRRATSDVGSIRLGPWGQAWVSA